MAKAKRKAKPKKAIRPPAPEHPWDRQADESATAFAAFREYLLLGPDRSIRRVVQKLDKSLTLIGRWSADHRWVARVEAFDAEAARREDEKAMEVLEQRGARQAEIATLALEAMVAPSVELMKRVQKDPNLLGKLDLDELVRLSATTARAIPRVQAAERLARGQSTTNVAGHRGGPLEVTDKVREQAERRAADMPDEALRNFLLGAETRAKMDRKKAGSDA